MSLRHALLGLLMEGPQTGYDLRRRFEQSLSRYAWHASHSHIYPELRKMTEDGLIEVVDEGARGSKSYGITQPGTDEFRQWMLTPIKDSPVRSEQTLRLFMLSALETDEMRPLLDDVVEQAEAGIAELTGAIEHIDASATTGAKPPFARFAAEFGLRYRQLQRDWALWAAGELDRYPSS
ncbi:PadR family transcriptional regulator [Kutzneria sp. CA-103260]|uniref:PadR family transcriptional regulator n=1 Tax=Kutzneria sp. CA-103260 TaxID=2802641 RepID=UPI001BAA0220|nr:PadR family transcriptional regulator [Kutzneria sp. CA-103260]QUQ68324.1 PadR family transcriptional regulator [Kutzneria sp. CA-103260]